MIEKLVMNNEAEFVRQQILDVIRAGQGMEMARAFYDRLFTAEPDLRGLFRSDMETLNRKMIMTLKSLFDTMPDKKGIDDVAPNLAVPHLGLGLTDQHYELFVTCLIRAAEDVRGYRMPPEASAPLRRYFIALGAAMRGFEDRLRAPNG
ncbi:globin domain-containing protein [Lacibacterium aquatile]|uniref:Globin domain-containing protein n=1 Tax=Lacibacterium aquatile TaxID=1168082 RepID=A0ABW5DWB8_9PROT